MPKEMSPAPLDPSFFERDALSCARELIGVTLSFEGCAGVLIETEAYREFGDEACHLFSRPSARAFAEKNPPGTAYVYLNYGVHWLANVLCRDPRSGEIGLVLFRALEPVLGIEEMEVRRGTEKKLQLCSGPGKLTAALGINREHHETRYTEPGGPILTQTPGEVPLEVETDIRVGISRAVVLPWRFLAKDHPGVSVKKGRVRVPNKTVSAKSGRRGGG